MIVATPTGKQKVTISSYIRTNKNGSIGNYTTYVRWYDSGELNQLTIPLKTKKDSIVKEREKVIRRAEILRDILNGKINNKNKKNRFYWLNKERASKYVATDTLHNLIPIFLQEKKKKVQPSTIARYKTSLHNFEESISGNTRFMEIGQKEIDRFDEYWMLSHEPATLNIDLRGIRCFLNHMAKKKEFKGYEVPEIKMHPVPELYERIISNVELAELLKYENWKEPFRNAFIFGYLSGCRIGELLKGEVKGSFLFVKPEDTKTKKIREIRLDKINKPYYQTVKEEFDKRDCTHASFAGYIDREIRRVCTILMEQGKLSRAICFHDTRHTYITRRVITTGSIKLVAAEVGHRNISTTELYTHFVQSQLEGWFPDLKDKIDDMFKKEFPASITLPPVTFPED